MTKTICNQAKLFPMFFSSLMKVLSPYFFGHMEKIHPSVSPDLFWDKYHLHQRKASGMPLVSSQLQSSPITGPCVWTPEGLKDNRTLGLSVLPHGFGSNSLTGQSFRVKALGLPNLRDPSATAAIGNPGAAPQIQFHGFPNLMHCFMIYNQYHFNPGLILIKLNIFTSCKHVYCIWYGATFSSPFISTLIFKRMAPDTADLSVRFSDKARTLVSHFNKTVSLTWVLKTPQNLYVANSHFFSMDLMSKNDSVRHDLQSLLVVLLWVWQCLSNISNRKS